MKKGVKRFKAQLNTQDRKLTMMNESPNDVTHLERGRASPLVKEQNMSYLS